MRLALFALALVACDPETQEAADPDLSRYALQADLDAALVEIDELREQIPQTKQGECGSASYTVTIEFETSVSVLNVSMCHTTDEGQGTEMQVCTPANGYGLYTPANAGAMGYGGSLFITCSESHPNYMVVYLPAAE